MESVTEEAMPRPYSADLRERVLAACERGEDSRAEIAERFSVGQSTLYGWLRQARAENRRRAKPARGGVPFLGGAAGQAALQAILRERRDATLTEFADRLAARTGRRWSPAAVCRALQRLGWPRKKRQSAPPSRRSARMSPPSALPGRQILSPAGSPPST
jgi:transposase